MTERIGKRKQKPENYLTSSWPVNRFRRWPVRRGRAAVFAVVVGLAGVVLLAISMAATNPNLKGDLNDDNKVSLADLSILLSDFNKNGTVADLNGDNKTTVADLSILLTNYGKVYTGGTSPPPATGQSRSIRGQALFVYKPQEWAGRPRAIYDYQVGKWYGNSADIRAEVNGLVSQGAAAGQLPLLITYNIPGRDCGSYSAGGAGNSAAYRNWINAFADGVGNRKAIIILEPDALAQVDCLNGGDQAARMADIAYAVGIFKSRTQASVYIDGGNVGWKSVADMIARLKQAGVANAAGFSLNVSNFKFTADLVNYGEQITAGLEQQGVAGVRYVIDTSRNGKGPLPGGGETWCNPPGRGLGKRPTTSPDAGAHNDAYLWIKPAGESDGPCNGGPGAGQWFPSYAQMLIDNAVY